MRLARPLLASVLFAAGPLRAQEGHAGGHAHDKAPALGTIVFPNTGSRAAQAPFLRGIALLHSFEYAEAARAFQQARRADPAFALAVWAEALTHSHVVWRYEDLPRSRATLARLGPTPAARLSRARDDAERAFGSAVEAFYAEGTLAERVRAYADTLRRWAARDSAHQEAAAFASHAVMVQGFLAGGREREALFREAIALSQRVLARNPNHPGGTHYLIHLYDSPGMAKEGLAFARAYDKLAPDAEHALHMPSHIYLQLGMWQDVSASNERAWAASRKGRDGADWHAFSWLHYSYLQEGRVRAARALVDSARRILARGAGGIDGRYALARLQFQQNVDGHVGHEPVPPAPALPPDAQERARGFHAQAMYWMAVDAARRGDTARFVRISAPYLALADSVLAGAEVPAGRATNALVIRAMAVARRGDDADTHAAWRDAANAEARLEPFVGPPERVFAGEQWMLFAIAGASHSVGLTATRRARIAEALPALQHVLRLCPQRSRTLHLLATVGDMVGPATLRNESFAALAENYRRADPDRKSLIPPNFVK